MQNKRDNSTHPAKITMEHRIEFHLERQNVKSRNAFSINKSSSVIEISTTPALVKTVEIFREHLVTYVWLLRGRILHLVRPFVRRNIPYLLGTSAFQFVSVFSSPNLKRRVVCAR